MKKIIKILLIVLFIAIIIVMVLYFINKNKKKNEIENEYQPQEEISDNQERQTMVSLYFRNKTTKEIEPEGRLVDVKDLIKDPYNTLMTLLIDGPKNDNLEGLVPNGTKINSIKLSGETVVLDLSNEFIDNHPGGKENEENTVNSIVKTLTELTEVNSVKILINGEENKGFKDNFVTFKDEFVRQD